MDDEPDPGGVISAHDSHILRKAFKTSIAELQLPEAQWVEHATAMMRDLTGSLHVDTGFIEWIIRKHPAAGLAKDDGNVEDHLVAVTLGIRATLGGLTAPAEMLIEVLNFEAPADAVTPPSTR
ncbi:hypothetical protein [Mesorhizobium sp. NZP2077]|uniref:hypothetical protein n=1 Tax=Mesorhizobium sp. NZP2077 TaxID=2483404 RepID=UPI001553AAB5|nr:hypothetical protein [Mesorhizobium sp. NZP2077]QKC82706.1 hypothetical protein EB232_14775 [Mesorhizobium sp. NZP2077]QKD16202.1 hypothetical protein HGP13_14575 [Mesorhizobium sp. NZP2077]